MTFSTSAAHARPCDTIASTMRALLLLLPLLAPASAQPLPAPVRGVYSDPAPLWKAGLRLNELGINAVFVHAGSINQALLDRASAEGARVFAEFPTLNGKGYVEKHPEAWPINEKGEPAPAAAWFMGVCPTDPAFRQYREKQLMELLDRFPLSGVWLDYFHWHAQFEEPEPILPETCFNDSCLRAFQQSSGVELPSLQPVAAARYILSTHNSAWRKWRASVLGDWARNLREIVKKRRPTALFGLYHCPWTDEEYSNARLRILALDLHGLNRWFDAYSPMVYHRRMGRPPEWVGQTVRWLTARFGPAKIWPIVQAHGEPDPIPAQEFEAVMRQAASTGVGGIMMFTTGAVAADPDKVAALRRLYLR